MRYLLCVAAFAAMTFQLDAATADEAWDNLKHITHKRSYDFVLKDGPCTRAEIVSIDANVIGIRTRDPNAPYAAHESTLRRADVIRITDGGTGSHGVLLSAQSSWIDVKDADPTGPAEHMLIERKSGTRYSPKQITVSTDSITFDAAGRRTTLPKSEVERVYYVRVKPLSDSDEYLATEAPWLAPQLWLLPLYMQTIKVLLYDASIGVHDSAVTCASWR
jgi:hypothetical protein